MGNMDDPGADWNDLARENAALRKEVEDLKRNPRYVEVAALRKKVEACEAEHPPEREYVEWCEAGKPDVTALRKRVGELESSITAHHAAHVMRRQPGDVCPVCSPVVPLPQKYGDEIPKSLDMADLCQAAVARADKLQADLDAALVLLDAWKDNKDVADPEPYQRIAALLEKRREQRG